MGAHGKAHQWKYVVAFVVSDEAGWVTGQKIHARGGVDCEGSLKTKCAVQDRTSDPLRWRLTRQAAAGLMF